MFPFLRTNEGTKKPTNASWGIVVTTPDGKRYFFPGGTPNAAMVVGRMALGDLMDQPQTAIEFGRADGKLWILDKVVKAPPPPMVSDGNSANTRQLDRPVH